MYLVVNMLCSRVDKHWCRMILHHHLTSCAGPPDARFARSGQALLLQGGEIWAVVELKNSIFFGAQVLAVLIFNSSSQRRRNKCISFQNLK